MTLHHLCHSEIETCFSDSPEYNFKYVYSVRKLSEDQVKSCISKQVLASTPGRLKVHLSVWPWELLELPSKKNFYEALSQIDTRSDVDNHCEMQWGKVNKFRK